MTRRITKSQALDQLRAAAVAAIRDAHLPGADPVALSNRMLQEVRRIKAELSLPSPPLPLARPVPVAAGEGAQL